MVVREDSVQQRQRWVAVVAAFAMPWFVGVCVYSVSWNFDLMFGQPDDWWPNPLLLAVWLLAPLGYAATIGFGTWFSWRATLSPSVRCHLLPYSIVLVPPCISHTMIADRVGLFVHTGMFEALDVRKPLWPGDSIASNVAPDFLMFASFVATMSIVQRLTGISLTRQRDPCVRRLRLSINDLLISTTLSAVVIAVVVSTLKSNSSLVERMGWSERFWLDSAHVIKPMLTGAAVAVTMYLIATAKNIFSLRMVAHSAVAITTLLVPEVIDNLQWQLSGRSYANLSPNAYNLAGAIGTFLLCGGCIHMFRRSGLRIDCERGTRIRVEERYTPHPENPIRASGIQSSIHSTN